VEVRGIADLLLALIVSQIFKNNRLLKVSEFSCMNYGNSNSVGKKGLLHKEKNHNRSISRLSKTLLRMVLIVVVD
jgi:hypothetical protein